MTPRKNMVNGLKAAFASRCLYNFSFGVWFKFQNLKKLKEALSHHPLFEARRLHLLAYHNLLCGRRNKCKAKLRTCCAKSNDMGIWLEVEWANKNMREWFEEGRESENVYRGTSMFALPKPTRAWFPHFLHLPQSVRCISILVYSVFLQCNLNWILWNPKMINDTFFLNIGGWRSYVYSTIKL